MSKKALILGAAAFLVAAPLGVDLNRLSIHQITAAAAVNVSFDVFFNNLQPYGSWVQTPNHPYVFVPADVGPNWAPYTNGHWVYTERFGWYFESDEPFASVTYHYGRWGYSDDIGWYWVPGKQWAPAWVVWRRGGGHVGWAPLPPEGTGYALDVNVGVTEVPQQYWVFVPVEQFLAPRLSVVVETGGRARGEFAQTQFVGPVVVRNNVVVNNAIEVNFIEQQTKQKVVVHQIQEVNDPKQAAQAPSGGAVKAFVANVDKPSKDAKPTKVADVKEVKARQLQGGSAAANAGATGGAPAANAGGGAGANGGGAAGAVAAGGDNCKPEANGKLPANCPPGGKPGAAANADMNKPTGGANAGGAANAEIKKPGTGGGNAGAAASAGDNKANAGASAGAAAAAEDCKPNAAGKLSANCAGADKGKGGASAELKQPAGAAGGKVNPKEKGAATAATDNGNAAATDKGKGKDKSGPAGQAADAGKGNAGCTPQEAKAGTCAAKSEAGANPGGGANAGPAVSQEKTGAITPKDGKQPDVQNGQTGEPGKCTPEMKKDKKC